MSKRSWIINGGLALLVLVIAAVAFGSVGQSVDGEDEQIRTVEVERGSVVSTVTASGELVAPTDVTLDFAISGRLVDVLVQPGDQVAVGDLLARLDDADALDQQASAEAGLAAAKASLDSVLNRLTPAQRSLGSAQIAAAAEQVEAADAALARAQAVAAANAALYDQQVEAARTQLEIQLAGREEQVAAARANLAAAEAALDLLIEGQTSAQRAVGNAQIDQAEAAVDAAETALAQARNVAEANEDAYDTQVESAETALTAAEDRLVELQEAVADCDPDDTPALCEDLNAALAQQVTAVIQAESALAGAEAAREQGLARDDHAVALARAQVDQAEAALELAEAQVAVSREDPSDAAVAQAEAQVQLARAQLEQALQDVDRSSVALAEANRQTGLARDAQATDAARSQLEQSQKSLDLTEAQVDVNEQPPTEAEIAAATAQVEQAEAALQRATRLAEETILRAPVAGTVAAINAEVGELVGGGGLPGAAGFIQLTDVADLIVEVEFSEADAIRVEIGRSAAVEVNALPDEQVTGTVIRIDPTATVVNDLVTYGGHVALTSIPDGVRPGQTVTVDVIIGEVDNALFVPSSSLERIGDETYVTVVEGDGETSQRPVRPGLEGDGTTQILAGLQEGEEVSMVGGGYVPPASPVGG